jgi:hypothetical protein
MSPFISVLKNKARKNPEQNRQRGFYLLHIRVSLGLFLIMASKF